VTLSRSLLSPMDEALSRYVLTDGKLQADDTPVPVLLPGNDKTKTGRLWTYVHDERNAGSVMALAVWFVYSPDRKGHIKEAACWAHARRKIHDVHVRTLSEVTTEALHRIGELYAVEAGIRGRSASERLAVRQGKTVALLNALEGGLREKQKTLSRHPELARAFAYTLNQWVALKYYAEDGWAEADNNIAENVLRTVSLGRKNYLFFGLDHGGDRGASLCPESNLRVILSIGFSLQAYAEV